MAANKRNAQFSLKCFSSTPERRLDEISAQPSTIAFTKMSPDYKIEIS